MSTPSFIINDKSLSAELNPVEPNQPVLKEKQFTVQSCPRPYSVVFNDESQPGKAVQDVLSENPNNILFIDERVFELYGNKISHPQDKIFKAKATEEFKSVDG